jgi:hypothetical protein
VRRVDGAAAAEAAFVVMRGVVGEAEGHGAGCGYRVDDAGVLELGELSVDGAAVAAGECLGQGGEQFIG